MSLLTHTPNPEIAVSVESYDGTWAALRQAQALAQLIGACGAASDDPQMRTISANALTLEELLARAQSCLAGKSAV
ncbi:MAG TPA: hypothetical protein VHB73_00505 [Alphaproteobacteria bacterium]|nr:hypothetical protein [Alphaproteobacteria bacterium]